MDFLETAYKNNSLHHAYLVEGNVNSNLENLSGLFKKLGVKIKNNPDFFQKNIESFTIADSRELIEMTKTTPLSGSRKFFVLSFNFINVEAQNSLLKIFEEPPAGVHFFVVVPRDNIFLPTLHSRFFKIKSIGSPKNVRGSTSNIFGVEEFLRSTPKERTLVIENILKKESKSEALNFLSEVEKEIVEKSDKINLKKILEAKKLLTRRSSSMKMVLEYISVVLPRV